MNPQVSTSWDRTPSQRAQPQGRHGAQGTWMVISEVCNSSWNWCCSKGQMDLIKYFHFKTLEFFYLAFSNWLFLIKKKKIPFQENFWYFSFQPRWNERCKQNGLMLDGHLVWETALLITCQKTKRLPPCKKGVIQFASGHQQKPLFFLATWSLDGFPKDQERVGLTVVENIWNRSQKWKNKNTSSSN